MGTITSGSIGTRCTNLPGVPVAVEHDGVALNADVALAVPC